MEINEPILKIKVTEPGQDAGVSSRLERGMRAFAISVNVTSGVSGLLRPGDRVDVYWTGSVAFDGLGGTGGAGEQKEGRCDCGSWQKAWFKHLRLLVTSSK